MCVCVLCVYDREMERDRETTELFEQAIEMYGCVLHSVCVCGGGGGEEGGGEREREEGMNKVCICVFVREDPCWLSLA